MRAHLLLIAPAVLLSVGCKSPSQPANPTTTVMTRSTVGAAFADHAMESADSNNNGKLSMSEWIAVGGTSSGFDALDTNASGKLSRIEVREGASTDKFWATVSRTMDVGSNSPMTPQIFRNPASARLFAYQF